MHIETLIIFSYREFIIITSPWVRGTAICFKNWGGQMLGREGVALHEPGSRIAGGGEHAVRCCAARGAKAQSLGDHVASEASLRQIFYVSEAGIRRILENALPRA